jgi:hypothetical protein
MFVLIGAILFLAVLFFIWAKYIRKSRRQSSRVLSTSKNSKPISGTAPNQRRRRRRWEKRNPTLAETGGLPPVKNPPTSA